VPRLRLLILVFPRSTSAMAEQVCKSASNLDADQFRLKSMIPLLLQSLEGGLAGVQVGRRFIPAIRRERDRRLGPEGAAEAETVSMPAPLCALIWPADGFQPPRLSLTGARAEAPLSGAQFHGAGDEHSDQMARRHESAGTKARRLSSRTADVLRAHMLTIGRGDPDGNDFDRLRRNPASSWRADACLTPARTSALSQARMRSA
jgi:hypothetical protein